MGKRPEPGTVGTRRLKTRLGAYLRMVRGGRAFVVTDRGRPVAELRPLSPTRDDREALLAEMEALGEVSLSSGPLAHPLRPAKVRGRPVSETLLEDREDRA